MKYVHYKEDGVISGFYDDEIHGIIPSPSVAIEECVWIELINSQGKYIVDTNKTIEKANNIEDLFLISTDYVSTEERERLNILQPSQEEIKKSEIQLITLEILLEVGLL